MKFYYKIIASGLGTGFSTIAPGTVGSVVACLLIWLFNFFIVLPYAQQQMVYCVICAAVLIIGVISTNALENEWGHDSPRFTIDEMAGMFIAMIFVPFSPQNLLIAFVAFRFFDILKPFWIRSMEKIHGGWGVMLDDVLAGIYANVTVQVFISWLVPVLA